MSILNTRFKRCAQFMADRRSTGLLTSGASAVRALVTLATFSRRHLCTMRAVRRKHTVEASEVEPGSRHQGDKPRNKVHRLEDDVNQRVGDCARGLHLRALCLAAHNLP